MYIHYISSNPLENSNTMLYNCNISTQEAEAEAEEAL